MAEKVSTLIIESNLECEKCYKKIQKILCKLQEKEKIRNINFDTSKNTVTISGPFDPVKLSKKLRCKACDAIKDIKIVEEKKPEGKKEDKKEEKAEAKKEEKKPEKKEEKKPDPEEKKKPDGKKPDEKKPGDKSDEKPKAKEEAKAAAPPPSSSTTVNVQFTQICHLCYPWPCSDPSHWGVPQQPQKPPQGPQWPCEWIPPPPVFPGYNQPPAWAPATPKRTCGGPSYCGGCGSCGGGMQGWPVPVQTPMMPQHGMGCSGPSSCRGCKGCRIVQEGKFIYEEYPHSSCAVM